MNFVINLENRVDRLARFKRDFPLEQVTRFNAIKGTDLGPEQLKRYSGNDFNYRNGILGCAESHISLWNLLLKSKEEYFLIFEDDASFDSQFKSKFEEFFSHFKGSKNWDLLYLGGPCAFSDRKMVHGVIQGLSTVSLMIPNKETIERSHTSLSTIAYGISRSGAEKLLKSVSNGVKTSIDWFMINSFVPLGLKVFSIYPYIVYCYDITDTDIQCDYSTSQPKI